MAEIGYIVRSFPRLSQTFVLNEVLALEELGVQLQIFAGTNPREVLAQTQLAHVRASLTYLDSVPLELLRAAHRQIERNLPGRYRATLAYVRERADLDEGYVAISRFACFDQAIYLAFLLREAAGRIARLHAHFAHAPTLIALLAHKLTGIPFSFTAHARDLFQIPPHVLAERVAAATHVVTCCEANLAYFQAVLPPMLHKKVRLIHHGVNLEGFQPALKAIVDLPPLIVSAGRLVEKKGFPDLLRACALLKHSGQSFRCVIYGEGPLRSELAGLADELGIAKNLEMPGERTQHELARIFQEADLFALTPFVAGDGDRDGVPNVLAEAMACGLPVVCTAVAGIPELVRHTENGWLCAPHDIEGLAGALGRLLNDPSERRRIGMAARTTVFERFDLRVAARELAGMFA